METNQNAAHKIRPILQAMERSIDAARRSRVKDQPQVARAMPTPSAPMRPVNSSEQDQANAPRLKARPKRVDSPFKFEPTPYRSQAG